MRIKSMPIAQLEHGLCGHAGQLICAKGDAGLGLGRIQQLRVLCQRGDQAVQHLRHHMRQPVKAQRNFACG